MSASPLPTEARRDDWPRLVANKANNHEDRLRKLENLSRAKGRFVYG